MQEKASPQVSNTLRRRQQSQRSKEEDELLEKGSSTAASQRILDRMLHILFIGFFLDYFRGSSARSKDRRRPDAESSGNIRNIQDTISQYFGPLMMLLLIALMIFLQMKAEKYAGYDDNFEQTHYEVLRVASSADSATIRKSYKALALAWHPDKNPGCDSCAGRFARISKAYEVLNNPSKRKAYDEDRKPQDALPAVNSVELTPENFEFLVLRSNEVWYVEAFDPSNPACQGFHPMWEEMTRQFKGLARFGRVDIAAHKQYFDFLPQRVPLPPVVWRFAQGRAPETFTPDLMSLHRSGRPLLRFAKSAFPEVELVHEPAELAKWWSDGVRAHAAGGLPWVLLVAGPQAKDEGRGMMEVRRMAHMWADHCRIAVSNWMAGSELLSNKMPNSAAWSVLVHTGEASSTSHSQLAANLKELPDVLQRLIPSLVSNSLPVLTVRNYQQLCGPVEGKIATRSYCLVFVDAEDRSDIVAQSLRDLEASRSFYAKDLADQQESMSSEEKVEPLHIQPVRLSARGSRLPWYAPAAGPAFRSVWAGAQKAPAFLLELETKRIAPLKKMNFRNIFQEIAFDDLKFDALSEDISLSKVVSDPEVSLLEDLRSLFSTRVSGVIFFVIAAFFFAVLPELETAAACGFSSLAAMLLLGACPALCRRLLTLVLRL